MPLVGLGTYNLNNPEKTVYDAIEIGYRHIDTALFYHNEKQIGKGISKAISSNIVKRSDLFLTTKIWPTKYNDIRNTLKQQLVDLQVDYIDLYLLHWPLRTIDEKTNEVDRIPTHIIWKELEDCVREGLIKSLGLSNFSVQLMLDILTYCEIKPVINEVELHPYLQQKKLIEFCRLFKIDILAYNSLTNKEYSKDKYYDLDLLKEDLVIDLAVKYNTTPGAIALNWALSQNICIIPKSNSESRLKENYYCDSFNLSKEDLEEMGKLNKNIRFCDYVYKNKDFGFGEIDIFA